MTVDLTPSVENALKAFNEVKGMVEATAAKPKDKMKAGELD